MVGLTIISVPVSVLKLLLTMFSRSLTPVCASRIVVGRYQVTEFCRDLSTPKRLHLKNEKQLIYDDILIATLHPKNSFLFLRRFPRARGTHIVFNSSKPAADNDKGSAKEDDSKTTQGMQKPNKETSSEINLDDGWYSLFEHPTKVVVANSEDMHTNVAIPGDQRTGTYDTVIMTYIHLWQKETIMVVKLMTLLVKLCAPVNTY